MLSKVGHLLKNSRSKQFALSRLSSTHLKIPDTAPARSRDFRLLSGAPGGDSEADVGAFYEITDTEFEQYFPCGIYDKDINNLHTLLEKRCLMIRPPALQIIDAMRATDSNDGAGETLPFFLTSRGERGTGKTATLLHTVHWARREGWITLHIPSGRELVYGGLWVNPSSEKDGSFDQPQVAHQILKDFGAAHSHDLTALNLQHAASKNRYGSTLADVLQIGIADEDEATAALVVLKGELVAQTERPVLIAIDEYNALFEATPYSFAQKQLESEQLVLVKAFKDLYSPSNHPARGAVVLADSNKFPAVVGHFKRNLSKDIDELYEDYKAVEVPPFSSEQYVKCVELFDSLELFEGSIDGNDVGLVKLRTQLNPRLVVEQLMLM